MTQLVEEGADLEIRQLTGETPAMVAANAGWDVVLRYLLSLKVKYRLFESARMSVLVSRTSSWNGL